MSAGLVPHLPVLTCASSRDDKSLMCTIVPRSITTQECGQPIFYIVWSSDGPGIASRKSPHSLSALALRRDKSGSRWYWTCRCLHEMNEQKLSWICCSLHNVLVRAIVSKNPVQFRLCRCRINFTTLLLSTLTTKLFTLKKQALKELI